MKKILLILSLSLPILTMAQGPTAFFIFSDVCLGQQLPVNDFSTPDPNTNSPIVSWSWEVNGSIFSTQSSDSYLFNNCSLYDITLTVTDADGFSDDITLQAEVFCLPTADFVSDIVCSGTPTNFADASTPAPSIVYWFYQFDGVGVSVNPVTTYTFLAAGTYMVGFNIKDDKNCADSIVKVVVVDSCVSNISNYSINNKKIERVLDITGKKTNNHKNNINIIFYNDGTIEKKITIE